MTNENTPVSLRYGMTDQQLCNVKANLLHRIQREQAVRPAVTDALIQEAGFETMPRPSFPQMSELISFAKAVNS